jgi:hypothetical protein
LIWFPWQRRKDQAGRQRRVTWKSSTLESNFIFSHPATITTCSARALPLRSSLALRSTCPITKLLQPPSYCVGLYPWLPSSLQRFKSTQTDLKVPAAAHPHIRRHGIAIRPWISVRPEVLDVVSVINIIAAARLIPSSVDTSTALYSVLSAIVEALQMSFQIYV